VGRASELTGARLAFGTERERLRAVAKILVHVTSGPEHPTRAALAFLVAKAAVDEGHEVSMFLAGDATQLLRDAVLDSLVGLGTGSLRESYDAVVAAGTPLFASGMSSKARGLVEGDLEGKPVELTMPTKLVQLALEADRVLTY
jgi:predicted peroxiredoxin